MTTADLVASESERRRAAEAVRAPLTDVLTSMAVLAAMLPEGEPTLEPVQTALRGLDSELRAAGATALPGSLGLDWSADGPDPQTMRFAGPADEASVANMVRIARDWATAAASAVLVYAIAHPPASGTPGIVTRIHAAARGVVDGVRNLLMTSARGLAQRLSGALWRWMDFAWTAVQALGRALGGGAALFGGGFATALLLFALIWFLLRKR